MVRSPPAERFGVWCCRVGTCWHRSRRAARTQLVSGRLPAGVAGPSLDPACFAGATFRRRDPSTQPASCSPTSGRSHATRPSAGRVRPVRELGVSGSGDARAGGHETGAGIAPEGDQELAGQRYDHDPADPPSSVGGPGMEPPAERAVGLEADPAPCHLQKLGTDPGGSIAADPLVALDVAAGPRGWRQAGPACELAAVAELAVEDLVREQGRVVRADPLQPGQRRDRRIGPGRAARGRFRAANRRTHAHRRVALGFDRLDLSQDQPQPFSEPLDLPARLRRERLAIGSGHGRERHIEVARARLQAEHRAA